MKKEQTDIHALAREASDKEFPIPTKDEYYKTDYKKSYSAFRGDVADWQDVFERGFKAGYQSKQELEIEILFEHKAMTKLLADITGLPIYSSVKKFKEQLENQSKQVASEWVLELEDAAKDWSFKEGYGFNLLTEFSA